MRYSEAHTLLDWLTIALRWITLMAFTLVAANVSQLTPVILFTLIGAAVWNVLLTFLAIFARHSWALRWISLLLDLLMAGLIFFFSGGLHGNLVWSGLLPILTSSIYFQMRGAFWTSLAIIVVQGGLALISSPIVTIAAYLIPYLLFYLVFGLFSGNFAHRFISVMDKIQRDQSSSKLEAQRIERERNQAIYKLISALNASLNYERVLETALDLGYTTLATVNESDDRLVSCVLLYTHANGKSAELRVGAARRFTPADMRITLAGTSGLLGKTIDEGTPGMATSIPEDPELGRIVALRACKVAYCIPLSSGLETYGVLLFAHPDENYFRAERREILDIIGDQAVVAMQNARLYRDLELEKERMMEIQEETRKKLARELHDGPTQSVAALAMRVNFARRLMERDSAAAADELFKVEDLARRTTKEIRHMLFTLRPLVLESQGLVAALESMAEKMRETYNQNVTVQADAQVMTQLEAGKQGVVFYIIEEAVNNARKHAGAEQINIRLRSMGNDIVSAEVQDNGKGFDTKTVDLSYENRGSLGMVNLRERTELLNGVLQIESSVGHGTIVRVIIPLTEEAADKLRRGP